MQRIQRHRVRMAAVAALTIIATISWIATRTDAEHHEAKAPSLHEIMETMDDPFRSLRRQLKDPQKNEASLEVVRELQKKTLVAAGFNPSMMESVIEKKRPRFLLEYKRKMVALLNGLLDVEEALIFSDNAKAYEAYRKIGKVRREGHEQFQEEEEEEED